MDTVPREDLRVGGSVSEELGNRFKEDGGNKSNAEKGSMAVKLNHSSVGH